MGFVKATPELRKQITGLNDFLQAKRSGAGTETDPATGSRTAKILDQFRAGRWRREIEAE